MKDKILVNQVMTCGGTIIASRHRHDYLQYEGAFVDGGTDYFRRGGKYTDMTIYEDDPFSVIRRFFSRLHTGIDGKSKPQWVPLYKMSDEWLDNVIDHLESDDSVVIYTKEKLYRKLLGQGIPHYEIDRTISGMDNDKGDCNTIVTVLVDLIDHFDNLTEEELLDVTPFDVLNLINKYLER